MQEHTFTGRIAGLVIFRVPEFGIRARFKVEDTGRSPVVCAVEGDVAREFVASYREGDKVTVRGIYEPRPSTAAANTPWVPRVSRTQRASCARHSPRSMKPHQIHRFDAAEQASSQRKLATPHSIESGLRQMGDQSEFCLVDGGTWLLRDADPVNNAGRLEIAVCCIGNTKRRFCRPRPELPSPETEISP